jgi:hypothetical protein
MGGETGAAGDELVRSPVRGVSIFSTLNARVLTSSAKKRCRWGKIVNYKVG